MPGISTQREFSSFLTSPNAFRQCTIPLLLIHSAISWALLEKLPDSPVEFIVKFLIHFDVVSWPFHQQVVSSKQFLYRFRFYRLALFVYVEKLDVNR